MLLLAAGEKTLLGRRAFKKSSRDLEAEIRFQQNSHAENLRPANLQPILRLEGRIMCFESALRDRRSRFRLIDNKTKAPTGPFAVQKHQGSSQNRCTKATTAP
jgi:hypothetical protein